MSCPTFLSKTLKVFETFRVLDKLIEASYDELSAIGSGISTFYAGG